MSLWTLTADNSVSDNQMGKSEPGIRLGELTKALGLVKETQLAATLRRALQAGLPIGRALVMSGYLTEDELNTALEIQALLRVGEITLNEGVQAFTIATTESVALGEALKRLGIMKVAQARSLNTKLGTLLLDSERIKPRQLDEAQKKSDISGSPLGRTLVLTGVLPQIVLDKALELQNMIREGMITYSEAVKVLHAKRGRKPMAESVATRNGGEAKLKTNSIHLADLLVRSKAVSEAAMADAIEHIFTMPGPLGDVLVDMGLLSQEALMLAFELQRSVAAGNLDPSAAAETLQYVATAGSAGASTLSTTRTTNSPLDHDNARLGDILRMCNFAGTKDVEDALELSRKCSSLIGEMLVLIGVISQPLLLSTLRCQSLVRRGLLRLDHGIKALQLANNESINFDEALERLGIKAGASV